MCKLYWSKERRLLTDCARRGSACKSRAHPTTPRTTINEISIDWNLWSQNSQIKLHTGICYWVFFFFLICCTHFMPGKNTQRKRSRHYFWESRGDSNTARVKSQVGNGIHTLKYENQKETSPGRLRICTSARDPVVELLCLKGLWYSHWKALICWNNQFRK